MVQAGERWGQSGRPFSRRSGRGKIRAGEGVDSHRTEVHRRERGQRIPRGSWLKSSADTTNTPFTRAGQIVQIERLSGRLLLM